MFRLLFWAGILTSGIAVSNKAVNVVLLGNLADPSVAQFGDDKVVALESGSYMDTVGMSSTTLESR